MMAGDLYYSFGDDNPLVAERAHARGLLAKFNRELDYKDAAGRAALLKELLGSMDDNDPPFIEPPFACDYGYNIHLGAGPPPRRRDTAPACCMHAPPPAASDQQGPASPQQHPAFVQAKC